VVKKLEKVNEPGANQSNLLGLYSYAQQAQQILGTVNKESPIQLKHEKNTVRKRKRQH